MSSRVNVDGVAFTDLRFDRLAQALSLADADHARSKVEWLWLDCTNRGECELPKWLVVKRLGPTGPDALVECELARWSRGRGDSDTRLLYICGALERTGWKKKLNEQSPNGGKARAQSASRVAGRFTSRVAGETAGEPASALALSPSPSPALAPTIRESGSPAGLADLFGKVDAAGGDIGKARNTQAARKQAADNPDHQSAIDGFHQRFRARYDAKPDWGGKQIKLLSSLLKRHGLDALLTRMDFMFSGKAKWPPGPYSLDTFVSNFDRWVDERPVQSAPIRKIEEL